MAHTVIFVKADINARTFYRLNRSIKTAGLQYTENFYVGYVTGVRIYGMDLLLPYKYECADALGEGYVVRLII